jgi:hypothetical protein
VNRTSFKFTVLHQGLWSDPKERTGFEPDADILMEHPVHSCAWGDMSPVVRAADTERRSIAQAFLEDIDGLSEDTCHHAMSCFGFIAKFEDGQSAADCFQTVPASKISNHVLKIFESNAEKQHAFPLHLDDDFSRSDSSSSSAEYCELISENESAADEEDSGAVRHVRKKRCTEPDSAIVAELSGPVVDDTEAADNHSEAVMAAKAAAVQHVEDRDNVFMTCKTFRKWKKTSEYRAIMGKIALFLLDPPYNIRRKKKSRKSHYDSLSTEEMKSVADVIAEGLRPTGRAYIFCSLGRQGHGWLY